MSENESVRKLADLKSFLESKYRSLENDLLKTKELIILVDDLLADKSFKRIEPSKILVKKSEKKISRTPLTTVDGVKLANFIVEDKIIRIEPSINFKFEASAPPLKSFFINKVLEPLKKKDEELIRSGEKSEAESFKYEIVKRGEYLKSINIKNYGNEKNLVDLKSTSKWALRRIYEKTIQK